MNIFEEFAEIINHIESANIKYALVGGVAMAFYAEPRFTRDIDMLLGPMILKKLGEYLNKIAMLNQLLRGHLKAHH